MPDSPIVRTGVPQDWQQQIQEIVAAAGRKEAEVLREVIAQYLGRTDLGAVKGALDALDNRVTVLERKSAFFGEIGGLK